MFHVYVALWHIYRCQRGYRVISAGVRVSVWIDGSWLHISNMQALRNCESATQTTPKGPSTQSFRPLAPNTIKGMAFGAIVLQYGVLGAAQGSN